MEEELKRIKLEKIALEEKNINLEHKISKLENNLNVVQNIIDKMPVCQSDLIYQCACGYYYDADDYSDRTLCEVPDCKERECDDCISRCVICDMRECTYHFETHNDRCLVVEEEGKEEFE